MPLEIRELHIKAVVGTDGAEQRQSPAAEQPLGEDEREAIVAICLERMLEILERDGER